MNDAAHTPNQSLARRTPTLCLLTLLVGLGAGCQGNGPGWKFAQLSGAGSVLTLCCDSPLEGRVLVGEILINPNGPDIGFIDPSTLALTLAAVDGPFEFEVDSGVFDTSSRLPVGSTLTLRVFATSCDFVTADFTLELAGTLTSPLPLGGGSGAGALPPVVSQKKTYSMVKGGCQAPPEPGNPPPGEPGTTDINGDGFADLIVGAPEYGADEADRGRGRVYVFFGPLSGVLNDQIARGVLLTGSAAGDRFGSSVAAADVNGDGTTDVIVGARGARVSGPAGTVQAGSVHVFFGGPGFASGSAVAANVTVAGESLDDSFGFSVAADDLDADGIADIVVGAPGAGSGSGRVYVFLGGPGIATRAVNANATMTGEGGRFGHDIALGDTNGDGKPDIIVGAPSARSAGAAYVHHGPPSPAAADVVLTGETSGDEFGSSVDAAAFGGSAMASVVVGAPGFEAGHGRAYVFHPGLASGNAGAADAILSSSVGGPAEFGSCVLAADVDGDGIVDVTVGAPRFQTDGGEGRAFVFRGPLPAQAASGNADFRIKGLSQGDGFGCALAASDVTGEYVDPAGNRFPDGMAELLIGAPQFNDGEGGVFAFHSLSGPDLDGGSAQLRIDGFSEGQALGDSIAGR